MSTILLYLAGAIVLIAVLDKIPGLKYLVKPIIDLVTWIFTSFFGSAGAWVVWGVKSTFRAHFALFTHLFNTRETLHPAEALEEKNRRGGIEEDDKK